MADADRLIRKIAAEIYDLVAESGEQFALVDVAEMVAADPAVIELGDVLRYLAAQSAVDYIDNRRSKPAAQAELFGDLDRVVALGDGVRRRKGSCGNREMAIHIGLVMENAAAVASSAAREQREYAQLLPFLDQDMTVDQAVAAIQARA